MVSLPVFGEVNLAVFLVYVVISTALVILGFWIANDKIQGRLFRQSL